MTRQFSIMEHNLLCIYKRDTRSETMEELKNIRSYLSEDEKELQSLIDTTLEKLQTVTDEEFAVMELFPDFTLKSRF